MSSAATNERGEQTRKEKVITMERGYEQIISEEAIKALSPEQLRELVRDAAALLVSGGHCPTCYNKYSMMTCSGYPWCPCACHQGAIIWYDDLVDKLRELGVFPDSEKSKAIKEEGSNNAVSGKAAEVYGEEGEQIARKTEASINEIACMMVGQKPVE